MPRPGPAVTRETDRPAKRSPTARADKAHASQRTDNAQAGERFDNAHAQRIDNAQAGERFDNARPSNERVATAADKPRAQRISNAQPGDRFDKARPSNERILAAAEKLFARGAYGDISLRQLIAATGVSTTAFYARFDSKEAVLDTLARQLFTELQLEAASALKSVRNLEEGIERGIDILCTRFAPRRSLIRLIISESGASGSTPAMRRTSYTALVGFLAHYLRALGARGRIDVADPDALAWALVGAIEMQIVRWAVWDELDVDELRAQLLSVSRAILPKERP